MLLPTKSTTAKQNGHFNEYETLKSWLERERTTDSIVSLCETVYADERGRLTVRGASWRCPSMIGSTSVRELFQARHPTTDTAKLRKPNIRSHHPRHW